MDFKSSCLNNNFLKYLNNHGSYNDLPIQSMNQKNPSDYSVWIIF